MKKSKLLAIVVTLAMVFGMMPMNLSVVSAGMVEDGDKIIITGEVTLDERLEIEGDKTLVLEKDCLLNATKGIGVNEEQKLTIEGEGKLVATGGTGQAGIGADNYDVRCGTVIINGGDITAIGGEEIQFGECYGSSGIGGAGSDYILSPGGVIIINGGKVNAQGGGMVREEQLDYKGAAGIGGANGQMCCEVVINGGYVEAEGGSCSAAIGSGNCPWAASRFRQGSIDITGGTIVAHGNIGGATWHSGGDESFNISISGGNITSDIMGGGQGNSVANITFDWTKESASSTRIDTRFTNLSDQIVFKKAYCREGDTERTALTPEDLTKDDTSIVMIPLVTDPPTPTPVVKKANTIKVTAKKKTIKAKKLKKKSRKVKALKVKNAVGKVTFKKVKKGTTKKIYKKVKITKKGIIKLKKGKYKKKTYKIKVKIRAAGNANYLAKTLTKTVKVKVK